MKTILLVGPWERCIKNGKDEYIKYIARLRSSLVDLKIIFSSTDPTGTVPEGLFDLVLSNRIEGNNELQSSAQNYTAKIYAMNSYLAVESCKDDSIIRVRSDLQLSNFSLIKIIFDTVEEFPNRLVIDFSESHRNLLPFNYSDFFVAGKSENLIALFKYSLEIPKVSKFSIHPFTSHTIGRTRGMVTNEQVLWYNYKNKNITNKKIDSLYSIYQSYKFLKRNFILVSREILFQFDDKLNSFESNTKVYYLQPSKVLTKSLVKIVIKEFVAFYSYSLRRLILKVIL